MDTQLLEQGQKQAKTSMVMGILAIVLCPLSELFFAIALVNAIKSRNRTEDKKMPGKAVAGIVMSIVGMVLLFVLGLCLSLAPSLAQYNDMVKEGAIITTEDHVLDALQTSMLLAPAIDSDFVEPADGEYTLQEFLDAAGPTFTDSVYEILGISDVSDLGYSSVTVSKAGGTNLKVTIEE